MLQRNPHGVPAEPPGLPDAVLFILILDGPHLGQGGGNVHQAAAPAFQHLGVAQGDDAVFHPHHRIRLFGKNVLQYRKGAGAFHRLGGMLVIDMEGICRRAGSVLLLQGGDDKMGLIASHHKADGAGIGDGLKTAEIVHILRPGQDAEVQTLLAHQLAQFSKAFFGGEGYHMKTSFV